jgi:beta-galactosidase/beta-glucuronidase
MNVRPEYPRPDFDRSHRWLSLNGVWDFMADAADEGLGAAWQQSGKARWTENITVPFAWETAASQIAREWLPVGWYRRSLHVPVEWLQERVILHFGAVHYSCQIWLNGRAIGEHTGGYLPFSFDITDALEEGQGELIVRVEAPLDKLAIPHGKQRSRPVDDYDGCAFTASSGIWQSVWLEGRPATAIEQVQLRAGDDLASITVQVALAGPHLSTAELLLQVEEQPEQAIAVEGRSTITLTLPVENPQLWTPQTPHLYHVTLRLTSEDGEDRVGCYTGLRRIETRGNRLLLNGERLYLRGALDQGYWPDSGYTAPTDALLRQDVELALAAGYNLIRKHIKFEDPRWLYWADRLGLLVWAEPPCVGRYSPEAIVRFEAQLAPMVERDGNHPGIILWGIYNEEWGLDWRTAQDKEKQEAVSRAYDLLSGLDASRPIIDDSGWSHVKTDVLDWHYYDNDIRGWNTTTTALVNDMSSWFGHQLAVDNWYETQLSLPDTDHGGLPLMNGEYGGGSTDVERGWHLRWQTQELRRHDAVSGYIYTELCDVEHELCGIYTAQRQLKPLGCNPAHVNAETVIIFDLVPVRPGLDYVAKQPDIEVTVRLSHQGTQPLAGRLIWSWEGSGQEEAVALEVAPFTITDSIPVRAQLPAGQAKGRLIVRFGDGEGVDHAYEFLDVELG